MQSLLDGPLGEGLVKQNHSQASRSETQTTATVSDGAPSPRWFSRLSAPEPPSLSRSDVAGFLRLVQEDLKAHDGDWTRAGFQALLVYRFGVWRMTIRRRVCRVPLSVLYRALFVAVRNFYGIELPFTARIGRRVIFEHQHGVVVHGNTEIGDDCIIRQGVTLGIRRLDGLKEAPKLGRGVDVGAGAKLLGQIVVGDYAQIGANAVVLNDVPPHALAVGVPARVIAPQMRLARADGVARPEARGFASRAQAAPKSVRLVGKPSASRP
jgi:serine O-acetyltransferase